MRKKRRTKYTWFPIIGGDVANNGNGGLNLSTVTRNVLVPADGTVGTDLIPVIPDQAIDEAGASDQLVNFIGTSWLIKRLVGKIHLFYRQENATPQGAQAIPAAALVSAGFFVARADAAQQSVPIGDDADLNPDYSPLALSTQREPWMWRRTWVLGNNIADLTNGEPDGFAFPATNASRSIVDGPHIDSKVARRSNNDERLWFAITASQWPPSNGAQIDGDGQITYSLDLRVLGALRRQRNRSAF